MWAIRYKQTGEFLMKLYRDDGIGLPDLHMTECANQAKVYDTREEACALVDRFKNAGCVTKFDIVSIRIFSVIRVLDEHKRIIHQQLCTCAQEDAEKKAAKDCEWLGGKSWEVSTLVQPF